MNRMTVALGAAALTLGGETLATSVSFNGHLGFHNDVARSTFSLSSDIKDFRLWTDSFQSGTNFDPVIALWRSDGTLISQNDDNSDVGSGQTYGDAGFWLPSLAAGSYIVTVVTYDNFAMGTALSDGFKFDDETPIPLEDWCEFGDLCRLGGYWHVNLTTSSSAPIAAPLPATWLLMATGLGLLGTLGLRRRKDGRVAHGSI